MNTIGTCFKWGAVLAAVAMFIFSTRPVSALATDTLVDPSYPRKFSDAEDLATLAAFGSASICPVSDSIGPVGDAMGIAAFGQNGIYGCPIGCVAHDLAFIVAANPAAVGGAGRRFNQTPADALD